MYGVLGGGCVNGGLLFRLRPGLGICGALRQLRRLLCQRLDLLLERGVLHGHPIQLRVRGGELLFRLVQLRPQRGLFGLQLLVGVLHLPQLLQVLHRGRFNIVDDIVPVKAADRGAEFRKISHKNCLLPFMGKSYHNSLQNTI